MMEGRRSDTKFIISEIGRLRTLGLSDAQIGRKIGASRASVAGVVHRHKRQINLAVQSWSLIPVEDRADWPTCDWKHPLPPSDNPTPCTLPEKSQCKWPVSDEAPFLFCSESREPGKPYCSAHMSAAYSAPKKRKRTEEQ